MSWKVQGRQKHGWFGHGTEPGDATDVGGLADRIAWTAHASLMHMPREEWRNGAYLVQRTEPTTQRPNASARTWSTPTTTMPGGSGSDHPDAIVAL